MPKEIEAKIQSCFEDDTYQTEVVVKTPEGKTLCAFTVKQLPAYEINRLVKPDDVEGTFTAYIKAGLLALSVANGSGELKAVEVNDAIIKSLSRSRLKGKELVNGLFETIGLAILDANTVGDGEAKNSERPSPS